MKRNILCILLLATTFIFAQETVDNQPAPKEQASPVEQVAPEEQTSPAEQAEPERTPEGFRIIRIHTEETKIFRDSVQKAEKEEAEKIREPVPFKFAIGLSASLGYRTFAGLSDDTYYIPSDSAYTLFSGAVTQIGVSVLIPLNQYNFAIRTGVLLEHASLTSIDEIFVEGENGSTDLLTGDLTETSLTIPLLFAMKTRVSNAMFEIGAQASFPLIDEYMDGDKTDFLENGFRSSPDISLLLGLEVFINSYISLYGLVDFQLNDAYKDHSFAGLINVSYMNLKFGIIVTPF